MSKAERSYAVCRIGPGPWDHLKKYPRDIKPLEQPKDSKKAGDTENEGNEEKAVGIGNKEEESFS